MLTSVDLITLKYYCMALIQERPSLMLRCAEQEKLLESEDEAVYPEEEQQITIITLRGYTVFQPVTCHVLGTSCREDMSDANYVGFHMFVRLKC
jgi:hypothetical protein